MEEFKPSWTKSLTVSHQISSSLTKERQDHCLSTPSYINEIYDKNTHWKKQRTSYFGHCIYFLRRSDSNFNLSYSKYEKSSHEQSNHTQNMNCYERIPDLEGNLNLQLTSYKVQHYVESCFLRSSLFIWWVWLCLVWIQGPLSSFMLGTKIN